jgi:hypothetical protein
MVASSDAAPAAIVSAPWGLALANRRFRWLLLAVAGVPISIAYVWFGVFKPMLSDSPNDFVNVYLAGARMLAAGRDPYLCNFGDCGGQPHYPIYYPPVVFWAAEPLAHLDARITSGVALVVATVLLLGFVWLVVRALAVNDRQVVVTVGLASLSFAPALTEVGNRNLQVAILCLDALVLMAWIAGDRWWGGAALGITLAIKVVQAPLLLFGVWGRRWWFTAAAIGVWAALWLIAAPRYLLEYVSRVLPSQAQGSSAVLNDAPFGTFNRLVHPESLYNSGLGGGPVVVGLAAAFAVGAIAVTWWRLRRPGEGSDRRALELAAALAASMLVGPLAYAGQFAVLLVPMIVLFVFGLRTGKRSIVAAVAASSLLTGPAYLWFTNALAAGIGAQPILQASASSAVVGVIVLWVACLYAVGVVDAKTSRMAASPAPTIACII